MRGFANGKPLDSGVFGHRVLSWFCVKWRRGVLR